MKAAKGAVKLVKIDIDKHPVFAGQLRVESIPTVYAFAGGRPVDAFMGAQPESKLKAFIDKLAGPVGASEIEAILALAKESLGRSRSDPRAERRPGLRPGPADGAAKSRRHRRSGALLSGRGRRRAGRRGGGHGPARRHQPRSRQRPRRPGPGRVGSRRHRASRAAPGRPRIRDDHEARLELAKALAGKGKFDAAADQLLTLIATDRDWNEGAARKELLTVFEAAGPASDVAKQGRRRLSSILFS